MRARAWLWLVGLGVFALAASRCGEPLRVATFNIRSFPEERTDRARVAEVLAQLHADLIAVQEIRDVEQLRAVLARASDDSGRDYRALTSTCGGQGLHVTTGLVWDAARLQLVAHRDYPSLRPDGRGPCGQVQPGLLGVFEAEDGDRFAALSIHFTPFPEGWAQRREQWQQAMQIVASVRAELGIEVIMLGDANSTGLTTVPEDERRYIDDVVAAHGYSLLTRDVGCTEYWRPKGQTAFSPSTLDHIVVTGGDWSAARAEQMCQRLACRVTDAESMDPDFHRVSDHCPVLVQGEP